MNAPSTQALLDAVKTPRHASRQDGEAAILAFLPVLARLAQQAAEEVSLAQVAEIAEPDEELRGRFELYVQTGKAQQRVCTEMEKLAREMVMLLRQRERYDANIRPQAVAKGYAP